MQRYTAAPVAGKYDVFLVNQLTTCGIPQVPASMTSYVSAAAASKALVLT
jgi:hypothetical protein